MHSFLETRANRCKRVAVILTLATWVLFITVFVLTQYTSYLIAADFFIKALLVSCVVCSPVALVLLIVSFRQTVKGWSDYLWMFLTIVPCLFGLLFAIFSILPGHFHG
jgi:hypothetical protein